MLPSEFTFIERGWFNANSTVINGRHGPTIIDTGHLLDREVTLALLRERGIDPTTLQKIVITHCHSDHHGGNRLLRELSGAAVGMGWITAEWFARGEQTLTWFDQVAQEVDVVTADFVMREGEIVELGDLPFEILHLPGHAPDTIGFYQPNYKIVICADAMWHNDVGVLNTITHPDALELAIESIEKLKQYEIDIAIPGHGGLITNVAENLGRISQKLRRFQSEPSFLAQHLLRRMMMYFVLRYQPASRESFLAYAQNDAHAPLLLQKYEAYLPHIDLLRWQRETFDLFLAQRLLVEDAHGRLSSIVRR